MPLLESPSSLGSEARPPRRPSRLRASLRQTGSIIAAIWAPIQEWLDAPTTRKAVLPSYLFIGFAVWFGLGQINEVNEQRLADATTTQCLTRVETRDSIRTILLAITSQFPDSPSVEVIVALIEEEYPALDAIEECGVAMPGASQREPTDEG